MFNNLLLFYYLPYQILFSVFQDVNFVSALQSVYTVRRRPYARAAFTVLEAYESFENCEPLARPYSN